MKKNVELNNEHFSFISRKKTNFFKKYKFIKILRIILIIMTFFMFLIIAYKILLYYKYTYQVNNNYHYFEKEKLIDSNIEDILNNYKYNKTEKYDLIPYLKYIEYAKEGISLNKIKYNNTNIPKISIVISLYNREKYIKSTIRSIQNQNLIDIEIIIIDDFSTDNSSKYVKEYQKDDPRIILLENKDNMGTLYSKSIGVLYSKGEYIQSLDSDDMLCNKKYLSLAYDEAIKGNYDFISSKALYIKETKKEISVKYSFWVVLWSKLIKKEIYLKSIYNVGIKVLKMKVKTLDDDIIALSMFIGKKSKKINIIGAAHFIHESEHIYFNAFMNKPNAIKFCRNLLITIKAFYEFDNPSSFGYGKFLFDNHFLKGPCKSNVDKEEIVKLNKTKPKI